MFKPNVCQKKSVLVHCAEWINNTEVNFPKLIFQFPASISYNIIPCVHYSSFLCHICYLQYFWFLSIFFHSQVLHVVSSVFYMTLILNCCAINLVQVASVPLSQAF